MTQFSPKTSKKEVLSHLDPVSKVLVAALNTALVETKRVFHSLGRPLKTDKPSDKSYFSHTMRFVAKRALEESGLQARVEEEQENSMYQLGQAANTGIVLQLPGIVARVLKSPIDEDLPPAGSESRAEYYEQRQYRILFPPLDGEAVEGQRGGRLSSHSSHSSHRSHWRGSAPASCRSPSSRIAFRGRYTP